MSLPNVVMCSMWRNDAVRALQDRVASLIGKTYHNLRWLWVVGDSVDDTARQLREIAARGSRIELVFLRTGITKSDPASRLRRMGLTANAALEHVRETDDLVLWHESDIISPPDIVERLVAHVQAGRCPIAGWPVLPWGSGVVFYDIWAYRKDGRLFTNMPPFHECYRPTEPFEVDSMGTCYMVDATDIRAGARFGEKAVLDLCAALKERGRQIWVDPTLTVLQPAELWTPQPVIP